MIVTVCELPNGWTQTDLYWKRLIEHLETEKSELLLLPEMPFYTWLSKSDTPNPEHWQKAVDAHEAWMEKLNELPVNLVVASRPVIDNGSRLNQGFIWEKGKGTTKVHDKYYLPDEPGYYEATWYERGKNDFTIHRVNGVNIGFLICTELWFTRQARVYLEQDIHLLVCPRATPESEVDIWETGGRAAAIMSGAFCLSSNYNGPNTDKENFGGMAWIIGPERGKILAASSVDTPFLTLDIDLNDAINAKKTYPRYVKE